MAILVKIDKTAEKNNIGYYKVSMNSSPDFYMGIDKKNRVIRFYATPDYEKPLKTLNCQDENEIIGVLSGIHKIAYTRAVIQAMKILDMDKFPDIFDYAA